MRYTKMLLLLLWGLLPEAAFAGRSLVLTSSVQNATIIDPNLAQNQAWRVEFQIHNLMLPTSTQPSIFQLLGVGAAAYLYPDGRIGLGDFRDTFTPAQPCFVNLNGLSNALVRFQRDPVTLRFVCELWSQDGSGYNSQIVSIVSTNVYNASGGTIGPLTAGTSLDLGFLRVFTTLVPPGSRPPTTADGGDWTELKFENNLNDSSGHGHNANVPGAAYVTTPNQGVFAFPKTYGAPAWTNWTSLRAGYPSQLDGRASYSLADNSSSVSYFWQQLAGPSTVIWANRTVATPTMTGLIFGTYKFSLRVADAAGNSATATLEAGAVAYDNNGVVIPADPKAASFFGPQIAFGQNPWGYMDERHLYTIGAQPTYQPTAYDSGWSTPGQGTVSYPFAGKGVFPGPACTTLSSGISATAMTIAVTNASCLSLSSLPTWILIGNSLGSQEMVRICSTTATSGAATLTACYDGRGMAGNLVQIGGYSNTIPAQSWSAGVKVGEMRIQGSGTLFSTDSARPICPAGLPGPPGPVVYSTGTVTLTPGSTTVVGNGTAWTAGMVGGFVRVAATHDGGTPFIFWAQIVTRTDATHLVLNRPAPTGIDGSAFSHKITGAALYLSLEFTAPDGHVARALQNGMGCESETAMFALPAHDIPALDSVVMSGVKYSYKRMLGAISTIGTFTANFYGAGLAARNFYYRSGYAPALALANSIDEYWVRDPEVGDGFLGGTPLSYGGQAIGAIADLLLNASTILTWPNVEHFATVGQIGATSCNASDTRDGGYLTAILTLAANYDTNAANRAAFKTALGSVLTRDQRCKRNASDGYTGAAVNSFAHGFVWNPSPVTLTLTSGSTAVTGSGFTAEMCAGTSIGTITVTHGSASATRVSGTLAPSVRIMISDTTSVPVYVGGFEFSFVGNVVSLAGIWPGASGTFSFMLEDNSKTGWMSSIWTDNADNLTNNTALSKAWACRYNSPTSLTLNRAWDGPSGSNYVITSYTVGAFGQQPFMLGVKTNQINWATKNDDPAIAAGYAAIAPLVGLWMANYGVDSNTKGTYYDRVFGLCEPFVASRGSFTSIHGFDSSSGQPACGLSGVLGASTERVNSAEAGAAMIQYYLADPTQARRAAVDQFYGAIFGYCPYTANGFYCDKDYVFGELSNASLGAYKWPGFFFGMGGFFTGSWPAVRNGVQPARIRTVSIGFSLGSAASAQVKVTQPSGMVSTFPCTATTCAIPVDDRQGSHSYELQYLSDTGQVLSTSAPVWLPLAPQP